ncbi:SIMPL domain-containing protein [Pontibacter vulgaris]|uniref:SIMPL domain-containing protein n=1 Tax=Pontibacter vulgaris TaxID=2905679 RepID=UPI001FA7E153|nr:SIMPL domain-containing protein [Pontibacter vulgaris]
MKIKLTFILLLLCFIAKAQTVTPENHIVVIGHATIDVPADQVKFSVTLQTIDSTSVDKVYQLHKVKEDKLVKLLQALAIPASDIKYSLLSVNKRQDYNNRKRVSYFSGNQSVVFVLTDMAKFSELQTRLINDGFTDFYSNFTSSELEKRNTEVMEKAIEVARSKAQVMAKAADRKIKRIIKVADTEDTDPVFRNYNQSYSLAERIETNYSSEQLIRYPQTIAVSAQVKVVFELK